MSSIQTFAIQLWNDLRARRLVPVAVLLLAGLVAAPLVLSKKADEAPAPEAAPAPSQAQVEPKGPEALAQVKLDEALGKGNGSSLSAFDVNNPFSPPDKVIKASKDDAQSDVGAAPDTGGTGDTTSGTDTGGGDTGGGDTGGGDTGGGTDGQPKTSEFVYVLDITFWRTAASAGSSTSRSSTCCRARPRRCSSSWA